MTPRNELEAIFPNLRTCRWDITSEPDGEYNCIAWAVGWTNKPWWPNDFAHWPEGVPLEETVDSFVAALGTVGFVQCDDDRVEEGFEKVALFALDGIKKHAARQLTDGQWTSKLGREHDITHATLKGVEGDIYGAVIMFLKRMHVPGPINA